MDGPRVRLRLDGRECFDFEMTDPEVELHDVRWGVGCYDTWVRYRAIECSTR